VSAAPYLPDHPAIVNEILKLHQEQRQKAVRLASAPPQLASAAAGSATSAEAP